MRAPLAMFTWWGRGGVGSEATVKFFDPCGSGGSGSMGHPGAPFPPFAPSWAMLGPLGPDAGRGPFRGPSGPEIWTPILTWRGPIVSVGTRGPLLLASVSALWWCVYGFRCLGSQAASQDGGQGQETHNLDQLHHIDNPSGIAVLYRYLLPGCLLELWRHISLHSSGLGWLDQLLMLGGLGGHLMYVCAMLRNMYTCVWCTVTVCTHSKIPMCIHIMFTCMHTSWAIVVTITATTTGGGITVRGLSAFKGRVVIRIQYMIGSLVALVYLFVQPAAMAWSTCPELHEHAHRKQQPADPLGGLLQHMDYYYYYLSQNGLSQNGYGLLLLL